MTTPEKPDERKITIYNHLNIERLIEDDAKVARAQIYSSLAEIVPEDRDFIQTDVGIILGFKDEECAGKTASGDTNKIFVLLSSKNKADKIVANFVKKYMFPPRWKESKKFYQRRGMPLWNAGRPKTLERAL